MSITSDWHYFEEAPLRISFCELNVDGRFKIEADDNGVWIVDVEIRSRTGQYCLYVRHPEVRWSYDHLEDWIRAHYHDEISEFMTAHGIESEADQIARQERLTIRELV